MKTYSVKPDDIKREMHVIDVQDKILGRVAAEIASLLMGKHKALFSRNADIGDSVTVINAEKVRVTGNKAQQKLYYRHSNYPGGFKEITYEKLMQSHPERIITFAVSGMLPRNHLHDRMLKRLKVFVGPDQVSPKFGEKHAAMPTKVKRPRAQIVNIPTEAKSGSKKSAKR